MYLAMVTPLDPRATGVAEYSLDLLPCLAQIAQTEIHVYSADHSPSGEGWVWHPVSRFEKEAGKFDLIIYQMGNSPAHDLMAPYLFRYPGLVVLHDLCLFHFYARQALAGYISPYLRAFAFGHGVEGLSLARLCLQGKITPEYPRFLLSEWLASRSLGTIVHSQHASQILGSRCSWANIMVAPMPIPLPPLLDPCDARRSLSLSEETYLILVFGVLNEGKNPLAILDAFQMLLAEGLPALLVFIGPENSSFHVVSEIERRELQSSVKYLGFVAEKDLLQRWFAAADVAINLRALYWGETSSSALRVLAAGTPLIVNDVGAFSELPDTVCVKLPARTSDEAQRLYQVLLDLWLERDRRHNMRKAARGYVEIHHAPQCAAEAYWLAINAIGRG